MPLTIWNCVLPKKNCFSKIGQCLQEITFRTEFPGSNFLLLTFLTGGKWDLLVANLRLATVDGSIKNFLKPNSLASDLGPVVQSIVSLTSSLTGQLVECFTT